MKVNKQEVLQYAADRKEMCRKIKQIIVDQLYLDMEPDFISDDQPLFGRGLELDSIDALELAVGIYNEFSVTVSDGDAKIFTSVNSVADYIMEQSKNQPQDQAEDLSDDEI